MRRSLLIITAMLVASAGCAGPASSPGPGPVTVAWDELLSDPDSFDGRRIRIEGVFYLSSFETSVLTDRLAESYPPQAGHPSIWVGVGAPTGPCIEEASDVGAPAAWGAVTATGTFRYQEGGGYGHLGEWDMTLERPVLTCASS